MAQVITLEAELEQVQKTTEEAYDISKYFFICPFLEVTFLSLHLSKSPVLWGLLSFFINRSTSILLPSCHLSFLFFFISLALIDV